MDLEVSLIAGIAAAVSGLVSLLRPLVMSWLHRRAQESVTVTITGADGTVKSIQLQGESGDEAIKKLLNSLTENKSGNQTVDHR